MADYKRYNTRSSKLTIVEVRELRRLYHEEGWSQGRLARKYDLSVVQVGRIVRGESQRSVPETADTTDSEVDPNAPAPSAEEIAASLAKLAAIDSAREAGDPLEEILRKRGGANPLARRPADPPPRVDGEPFDDSQIEETRNHEQDTQDDS